MDNRCPACPPSTSTQNTWDQDPHNAYNNAFYHYQAYIYYWNLYNAHFGNTLAFCGCCDKTGQRHSYNYGFPSGMPGARCNYCPNENFSPVTEHSNPREAQPYFQKESYGMEVEEEEIYDSDIAADDDSEHGFELDERFCQFLKQSEKHRKEREKERRANAKLDEYVEAGKIQINASTLPPEEHQEAKRKKAMKSLYGDKAPYIMSLEASLQLHYDRNFDSRQPKFWPNIPLKF